jgi:SPP1 gp7 family putative phage head morphogenesis protein
MGNKNREYWKNQAYKRDKDARMKENQFIKDLYKVYEKAYKDIEDEILLWYIKNSKDDLSMSYSDAIKKNGKVTYLQQLQNKIDKIMIDMNKGIQMDFNQYMTNIFKGSYMDAMKSLGIPDIKVINENAIKILLLEGFKGRTFSDSIWNNKEKLFDYLKKDLAAHLIKGTSMKNMAKDLRNKYGDISKKQAERLVRTETSFAMNQGHLKGYMDADVEKYELLAHLDNRTSPQCT